MLCILFVALGALLFWAGLHIKNAGIGGTITAFGIVGWVIAFLLGIATFTYYMQTKPFFEIEAKGYIWQIEAMQDNITNLETNDIVKDVVDKYMLYKDTARLYASSCLDFEMVDVIDSYPDYEYSPDGFGFVQVYN